MRCECCNEELSDVDATARFAETGNFVNMCKACRRFLPRNLEVVTRPDLEPARDKYQEDDEPGGVDDYWKFIERNRILDDED